MITPRLLICTALTGGWYGLDGKYPACRFVRPIDGIDYIKKYLGTPAGLDVDELRAENEELKMKNANLQQQVLTDLVLRS